MNRSGNNFREPPPDYGAYAGNNFTQPPRDYGAYASKSYIRISQTRPNVPRFVVPSLAVSDADWRPPPRAWWILEERLLGVSSLLPGGEEDSRLTEDEQKEALNRLRKEIYNPVPKRMSTKSCGICFEDFKPKEMVTMTPCNHRFHEECIVPWVKSHGQCYVCRFALCKRSRGSAVALINNTADVADELYYF